MADINAGQVEVGSRSGQVRSGTIKNRFDRGQRYFDRGQSLTAVKNNFDRFDCGQSLTAVKNLLTVLTLV